MITTINEYRLILETNLVDFVSKLDILKQNYIDIGCSIEIKTSNNQSIYLEKIIIPREKRNQGLGKQFMKELVTLADEYNIYIQVAPSNIFGSDITRLNNFYYGFGFKDNVGRNRNDRFLHDMIRKPKRIHENYDPAIFRPKPVFKERNPNIKISKNNVTITDGAGEPMPVKKGLKISGTIQSIEQLGPVYKCHIVDSSGERILVTITTNGVLDHFAGDYVNVIIF